MADYLSFTLVGVTSSGIIMRKNFAPYFAGATFGLVLAGVLNDTLFRKSHYLVVVITNLISLIWNFSLIFVPHHEQNYVEWSMAIFGINN